MIWTLSSSKQAEQQGRDCNFLTQKSNIQYDILSLNSYVNVSIQIIDFYFQSSIVKKIWDLFMHSAATSIVIC